MTPFVSDPGYVSDPVLLPGMIVSSWRTGEVARVMRIVHVVRNGGFVLMVGLRWGRSGRRTTSKRAGFWIRFRRVAAFPRGI